MKNDKPVLQNSPDFIVLNAIPSIASITVIANSKLGGFLESIISCSIVPELENLNGVKYNTKMEI